MATTLETAAKSTPKPPPAQAPAKKTPDVQQLRAAVQAANRHASELRTKHEDAMEKMAREMGDAERAIDKARAAYEAAARG